MCPSSREQVAYTTAILSLSFTARHLAKREETIYGCKTAITEHQISLGKRARCPCKYKHDMPDSPGMSRLGPFRSLWICLSSHKTRSPRIAGEQFLPSVPGQIFSLLDGTLTYPRHREVAPSPTPPLRGRSVQFGPVRSVRPAIRCARSNFPQDMPMDFC